MQLDWSILLGPSGALLLQGARVTLQLAALALTLALVLGFLFGVLRWSGFPPLKLVCWFYVEFCRNTPPLVQILFWYFSATVILPAGAILFLRDYGFEFAAAIFALGIYHSAFIAEIVRGGLNAIPRGQYEAAQAIGLSFPTTMRSILFPQLLRSIAPMLISEAVSLTKNTSLALAIGVHRDHLRSPHYRLCKLPWRRGADRGHRLLFGTLCLDRGPRPSPAALPLAASAGARMNWQLVLTENNIRRLLIGDFPDALGGVALTLVLTVIGIIASTLLGFVVGYLRFTGPKPLRYVARRLRRIPAQHPAPGPHLLGLFRAALFRRDAVEIHQRARRHGALQRRLYRRSGAQRLAFSLGRADRGCARHRHVWAAAGALRHAADRRSSTRYRQ